jgi:hypothetical protein
LPNLLLSTFKNTPLYTNLLSPIPPRTLAQNRRLLFTLDGSFAILNFTKIYETPMMPICFPKNTPNMMTILGSHNIICENNCFNQ